MTPNDFDLSEGGRLDRLAGHRVLVLGDMILDRYLWGEVERISPEAPVPIVTEERTTEGLGGALNVARNLAAAGARVEAAGVVGRDEAGRRIRELLTGLRIGRRGLIVDAARPTTVKTRIMNRGQQLMRLDRERNLPCQGAIRNRLFAALDAVVPRCAAVIISDYRKGVIGAEAVRHVARLAAKRGIPVVTDPKRSDFAHYVGSDYLTPNLKEAAEAAGAELHTLEAIERAGRRLTRRFKGKGVVITRGHEGVSLIGRGRPVHIPARAREVFDVTGAGDTFIAHFALALAGGFPPAEAARIGNAASGVAVSKLGAVTVSPAELAAAMGGAAGLSKVRSADDLRHLLDGLRSRRRRIVFTNGCFDLFHAGHVRLLHEARALGDVLVVGLNTDRSVRRIKGKPRPILPAGERAAVLAALGVVDYLVFFDEDTPEKLLEVLAPDVLVKGRRPGEPVVGRAIVEARGGRVVELEIDARLTTGEIMGRIKGRRSR